MSGFASAPLGGGGAPPTCASTLENLEFSCAANFGYAETSVCIDTDKRLGKGASKEVFLLTRCRDFASELKKFKLFKQVGSRPIDKNLYVMAIMTARSKEDLSECLNEFFFSVQIHRCGIPMIKVHLCIVEIIFNDDTSVTITFDRNYYTVARIDNSVGVKTTHANEAIQSAINNKPVKTYKVHFFEERGYDLRTTLHPNEAAVNEFVRRVAAQYLAFDFKPENILISLGNNNNNQLVLCDADKQFFITVAEVNAFFNYDCSEGIIQYMLSMLYINYYLYYKNRNDSAIALFGYLDDNKLKQQLLNPQFLLFLAHNMFALEQNRVEDGVFTAKLNIVRYLAYYTKLFDPQTHEIDSTNDLYIILRLYLSDVQRATSPSYPHTNFYGDLDSAFAIMSMQMSEDVAKMTKNLVIHLLHCAISSSQFFLPSPSPSQSPYSLQTSLAQIEQEYIKRFRENVDYLSIIEDQGGLTSLGSRSFGPVRAWQINSKQNGTNTDLKKIVAELNKLAKEKAMKKPKGTKVKKTNKGGKPRNKKTHKRSCKKTRRRSHF